MSKLDQEVDELIHEEKLEPGITLDEEQGQSDTEEKEDDQEKQENQEDKSDDSGDDDNESSDDGGDGDEEKEDGESDENDESEDEDEDEEDKPDLEKEVEQAKSLINQLQENGADVFDEQGNPKKFEEVVPAGAYFLSVLEPVKVTDKEGKTHEFLLLSDVEKKFPDGFEAKNNIEQMKFEKAIMGNEGKFDDAIKRYEEAKGVYEEEVKTTQQESKTNESIASEYKAMAEAGLVPKIGDPKDPGFKDSDAVKELDKLLTWIDTKNEELKKKGLGQITSLYVAKQLMDIDDNKEDKNKKKEEIVEKRKGVARLTKTPEGGDKGNDKKKPTPSQPMSTFIENLLEEEDIK